MFEEADSLGVSQGQGRGFAQVFDSTYNPVFKEETARLIKEDKEDKKAIDKQLESIDSGVWFRDQPLVQEKILELQKYAQDNPRNIIKGNTNEALEYKKKITDLKALVYNAKLAEQQTSKYLFALKQDGDKWDQEESRKTIQKFVESPGDYDFTNFQLVPSFSMAKYEKQFMQPEVSKLINTITQSSKKDEFGNYNYDQVEKTSKDAMDNWANRMWNDSNSKMKQTYGSLDEFKQAVYDYGNLELKKNVKTPYKPSQSELINQVPYEIKPNQQFDFSQKVGSGEGVYGFTDDKTTSLYGTTFNVTEDAEFQPNFLKQKGGVLIGLRGAYQAKKDEKGEYSLSDEGFELGDKDNIFDRLFKDQGSSKFKANSIQNLPVFKEGTTVTFTDKNGKKRTIDLSNTVVSDDMLEKGEFRGLKFSDENISFEPIVVGNYEKEVKKGKQSNVLLGLPYREFRGYMQSKNTAIKEMQRLESQAESKDLLTSYSYTEGLKRKKGETNQPTQTKKAPGSTSKKRVYTKEEQDEYNEYKSSLKKGVTPISIDKYFE